MPILALALALVAPSAAQDAVSLEVVAKGQKGHSLPGLVVVVNQAADDLRIRVDCGGAFSERAGSAAVGERLRFDLDVNPGAYTCTGTLAGEFADGSTGEMPLKFDIQMLAPLAISVPKESVDLQARTLQVVMDRPADRVDIKVFGPGGAELGTGTTPAAGQPAGAPILVQWQQGPGEVLRIEVVGHDQDGFWSQLELSPWFYAVPHEDVIFETNSAVIRASEHARLDAALDEIHKITAKYGADIPMKLYVGGYTDTVGDHTQNRFLSDKRAAAIAKWFQSAGFKGEIYFQGFGEEGLAVATPDEVDTAANRRAVYIVAAEAPPTSRELPRSAWTRLQ